MHAMEATLRALVGAHADIKRYQVRRPVIELSLLALHVAVLVALGWSHLRCISSGGGNWSDYALLWFFQQYATWICFHMGHEWTHSMMGNGLMKHLYLTCNFCSSVVSSVESQVYYLAGHLEHHYHNGKEDTFLTDFLKEPWFPGKDADVLFFGVSHRNPFKSDTVPTTLLLGPLTYLMYSSPVKEVIMTVLLVGTIVKFGWNVNLALGLSLMMVRFAFIGYLFANYFHHACIYFLVFSVINMHYSLLATYVPMTHPERNSRDHDDLRGMLERRFKGHFPTHTPSFPLWIHYGVYFGLTLHIEHHSFPRTPWYNLHLVNQDIKKAISSGPEDMAIGIPPVEKVIGIPPVQKRINRCSTPRC